jgi:hypothetical protein
MRVYKSYPKAFLFEILIASLTLLFISFWGIAGLVVLALFGLRPLIFKIENKNTDESFAHKHYRIFKLSIILTAVTIILVYSISDLLLHSTLDHDFLIKMCFPYFLLIHGCIGTIYFRK